MLPTFAGAQPYQQPDEALPTLGASAFIIAATEEHTCVGVNSLGSAVSSRTNIEQLQRALRSTAQVLIKILLETLSPPGNETHST